MSRRSTALFVGMVWCVLSPVLYGQTVRIVSYDFATSKATPMQAAGEIERYSPDIVLLQGVRSWNSCRSLAQALRPVEYHVVACSAFEAPARSTPRQTAILSRYPAVFAWHERVGSNHVFAGYAFGVVQVGSKRLGVFSAQIGRDQQSTTVARKIISQMQMASNWTVDRPDAFLVGASAVLVGNSVPHNEVKGVLIEAGLQQTPGIPDRLAFLRPAGIARAMQEEPEAPGSTNRAVLAIQVNLDPDLVGQPGPEATKPASAAKHASTIAPGEMQPSRTTRSAIYSWVLGIIVLSGLGVLLFVRNRKRKKRISLCTPSISVAPISYVVVAPDSLTGTSGEFSPASAGRMVPPDTTANTRTLPSIVSRDRSAAKAGLLNWLKQEFVRRLIHDRSELLQAQAVAIDRVDRTRERLAWLEQRIEMQNSVYLERIEALTLELGNAREENRELIRISIAQVKAEMETARTRMLSES